MAGVRVPLALPVLSKLSGLTQGWARPSLSSLCAAVQELNTAPALPRLLDTVQRDVAAVPRPAPHVLQLMPCSTDTRVQSPQNQGVIPLHLKGQLPALEPRFNIL